MARHRICRGMLLAAIMLIAGCDSLSTSTQDPPFSDLQYERLKGRIDQVTIKVYVLERPADIAAALSSPETFSPPTDLPVKTLDGEDLTRSVMEVRFGQAGNTLASRMFFPSLNGGMATTTLVAVKPGLRRAECSGVLPDRDGKKRPFSCGQGEWRYQSPGVWHLVNESDTSVSKIEKQVDAQGRLAVFDQQRNEKAAGAGKTLQNVSLHSVSLAYDADGRVAASRDTRNGQVRYRYTTYSNFDPHGNPQRALAVSSTKAEQRDPASVVKIELRLYAYTYYDEIR